MLALLSAINTSKGPTFFICWALFIKATFEIFSTSAKVILSFSILVVFEYNKPIMLEFYNNILDNIHISDITEREMTLISRAIPSTVCVIFLFGTILSLCKLTNAGGFSFSLWGAGFNIPGNPLLGLPGFPGNNGRKRRQTIPRVNGGN